MRKYQPPYKTPDYKDNLQNINLNSVSLPDIKDRIIIMDTVTTGANPKDNNIIEIGGLEMIGGKITGCEFHAFLHPRYSINEITKQKANLTSNFYEEFYKDTYASDHKVLEQFKNFVNQSSIVAHNAFKDMEFINNEFIYHKINVFPRRKFFCTLSIFRQMFPNLSRNICSLSKCCEYLDIKLPTKNFHSAQYDSLMVAKLMAKIFDIITMIKNKNTKKILPINMSSNNMKKNYKNKMMNKEESKNDTKINEVEKNINDINFNKINSVNVIHSNYSENKEKEDNNLLNKKRNLGFEDLINNLKNKVNPQNNNNNKNEDVIKSINKSDIEFNANDFNIINQIMKEK